MPKMIHNDEIKTYKLEYAKIHLWNILEKIGHFRSIKDIDYILSKENFTPYHAIIF